MSKETKEDKQQVLRMVGDVIRELRTERGMSQKDLATAIGHKDPAHIGRIERGETEMYITTLDQIAEAFGLSFDEMTSILFARKKALKEATPQ